MFTDILVSIMQSTNPVNNNINAQILNGIANIQSQLTNQQTEYGKLLFLKLTEFKKEYIDDLKMILSSNIADKIAPLIKDSNGTILDKTQLLLSELVPKNNENLSKQINENIKSFCSSITEEISKTSKMDGEPLSQSSLDGFIKTIDAKDIAKFLILYSDNGIPKNEDEYTTMNPTDITNIESRVQEAINIINNEKIIDRVYCCFDGNAHCFCPKDYFTPGSRLDHVLREPQVQRPMGIAYRIPMA